MGSSPEVERLEGAEVGQVQSIRVPGQVQSAARVVQAIELVARLGEAKLGEVAAELGIHKSNALRLLETLRSLGWIVVDEHRACYRVGPALIGIGQAAAGSIYLDDLLRTAGILRDNTGETVHIAVPHEERMLIVARAESRHALRVSCQVGSQDPLYNSALGKAYLAALPDEQLDALLPRLSYERCTENTITSPAALRRDIELTRARGFAINNGEARPGVKCMGFAVHVGGAVPIAALSITGPAERWTVDAMEKAAPMILEALHPYTALAAPPEAIRHSA